MRNIEELDAVLKELEEAEKAYKECLEKYTNKETEEKDKSASK